MAEHAIASDARAAIAQAAERLQAAAESAVPCAPVRDLLQPHGADAAYAVQQIGIERRLARGLRAIGRKIGLTSPVVQRQLGVDQPDYGALLSDMILGDGATLAAGAVMQPKAEAEVAFLLGRDLDMPAPNVADVLRATDAVLPAIEIVGSRIAGWDIQLVDTIADNASAGMFVLGTPARAPLGFDFAACEMELTCAGAEASRGSGAACMGSPLNAVAWLAGRMQAQGQPLRAGEIILSGALGPMLPLTQPGPVEASISGLGRVSFVLEV